MKLKEKLIPITILLAVVAGYVYINYFGANVPENLQEEGYLKIPDGSSLQDVENLLKSKHFIEDEQSFNTWAKYLEYNNPRAGRYKITPGWSSYELVHHLQRGEQAPLKITLNNERNLRQLSSKLCKYLEPDSATFIQTFTDKAFLDSVGATESTLMSHLFANTYEFYWNTTPESFLDKMHKEYKKFWTEKRLLRARMMGLTPEQVYTMASIVEGESTHVDEFPRIAGTYLNRLTQHIKLQADPTVQYALIDVNGGGYRRLYNVDYQFPHPYNTYLHEGLPPGPVSIASSQAIEAVLNAETNNYMFFVARPDNSGYHNFAETFEAHQVNVKHYQDWMAQKDRKGS